MHLGKLYKDFNTRCSVYLVRVREINSLNNQIDEWKFNHLSETLISDIWQSWCRFSRTLFMSSCRGAIARNGKYIQPINGDHSWQRLGYIAKQNYISRTITANGHLSFKIRQEPTWGDLNAFIKIVTTVKPSNYQTLIQSYGSFNSLKHLQRVRNSCAHKNIETMIDIHGLSNNYSFSSLKNSTDLAWKVCRTNKIFAIELWLYEMKKISDLATATN